MLLQGGTPLGLGVLEGCGSSGGRFCSKAVGAPLVAGAGSCGGCSAASAAAGAPAAGRRPGSGGRRLSRMEASGRADEEGG